MLNNKNEVVCVLPTRNVNGGYMKKTYKELIEELSQEEIDELYMLFGTTDRKKYVKKC